MPTFGGLGFGGGGIGAAVFNEASSTSASFYTMTNPDSDGKNYRVAEFLNTGTLVLSKEGLVAFWFGGGGQAGYGAGQSGNLASGGACGGILILKQIFLPVGTYTVTVGAGGSNAANGTAGGTTNINGPHSAPLTRISAAGGGLASPATGDTTPGAYGSLTTTFTSYSGGTAGGGAAAGRAGAGGNGSSNNGGAAATITGWTPSSFQFGRGGSSIYGPTSGATNSGGGGDGSDWSNRGSGGSGRAYVRVQI